MTWPSIHFDPIKLFDLRVSDLLLLDPYFARIALTGAHDQISDDLFIGLLNAPDVAGHLREACPERAEWLSSNIERFRPQPAERIREAEARVVATSCPWNVGMAKDPAAWDALPWSYWDPAAIYDRVDLRGKTVLDAGAGTGQVTLRCAPLAGLVYALEPVARLRRYIERKTGAAGLHNVHTLASLLEAIPLPDESVDAAILSNGSFGWNPESELGELERVTRPGGTILMLAPCNSGDDHALSAIRNAGGYEQFDFEIPCDGPKPSFIRAKASGRS